MVASIPITIRVLCALKLSNIDSFEDGLKVEPLVALDTMARRLSVTSGTNSATSEGIALASNTLPDLIQNTSVDPLSSTWVDNWWSSVCHVYLQRLNSSDNSLLMMIHLLGIPYVAGWERRCSILALYSRMFPLDAQLYRFSASAGNLLLPSYGNKGELAPQ